MANIVYQGALLFFYVVCFALAIASISGKSWLENERRDLDGIIGEADTKYFSRISLWKYCDWNDNCFDIDDLFNNCKARRDGTKGVRAMMILGIMALCVDFGLLLFAMRSVERANRQRQLTLGRVFAILHLVTAFCFFISWAVWANVADRECNGVELRRDGFDYGWCFALTVAISILLICQYVAIVVTPKTYFRVDESLFAFIGKPANKSSSKRSGDQSLHSDEASPSAVVDVSATEPTSHHNRSAPAPAAAGQSPSEHDSRPLMAEDDGHHHQHQEGETAVLMTAPDQQESSGRHNNNDNGDFTV